MSDLTKIFDSLGPYKQGGKLIMPLLVLFVICLLGRLAEAQYGGGTGESNDPYLIFTAEQLNTIGTNPDDWDKDFKLMEDIDLSNYTGTSFNIIGYVDWRGNRPFRGVFDGNSKKISNFTFTSTGRGYIGLFGYVSGENAEIKNLQLLNPDITAGAEEHVGSFVGLLSSGTMTGCYAQDGSISGTGWSTGGLVGSSGGTIDNCHVNNISVLGGNDTGGLVGSNDGRIIDCDSQSDVSGDFSVGGLVGYNLYVISNCYSTGSVSGDDGVGGLVGDNEGKITNSFSAASTLGRDGVGGLVGFSWGTIVDCYATGGVSGNSYIGGLVGYNNVYSTIINCYSVGNVMGMINVGGLVGYNYEGEVINSLWDVLASGQIGSDGGMAKATFEMKNPDTFMNLGWDFVGQPDGPQDIWAEPVGGGYMLLWWQLYSLPELPNFAGGTGEPDNPYLISTADELNSIGNNPRLMKAHFKLINDIDLAGTDFFFIGSSWYPYGGIFDGNNKKISNFAHTSEGKDCIGLFGYLHGENAQVKDLGLINPSINAGTASFIVGTLVGELGWAMVTNCYAEGGSVSGGSSVGGLVGANYYGLISDSYTTCAVSGEVDVGGLVGFTDSDTEVSNCYSTGSVMGGDDVGGLVGWNSGIINKCYYVGSVSGNNCIGGLVGYKHYTVTNSYAKAVVSGVSYIGGLLGYSCCGTTLNCYAAGTVTGNDYVGGLVGENYESEFRDCFWDTQTSGLLSSDGGMGKTTAQMQTRSTFTDAGWDFVAESVNGPQDIWSICEGTDYPKLAWQFVIADFDGDNEVGLADFALLAGHWLGADSSFFCGGTDLSNDGKVDFNDLKLFADNWLAGPGIDY